MSETKAKVIGKQNGVFEKEELTTVMFRVFLYSPIEYSLASLPSHVDIFCYKNRYNWIRSSVEMVQVGRSDLPALGPRSNHSLDFLDGPQLIRTLTYKLMHC